MDPTHLDRIARLFASRRLSRRAAITAAGTAALGIAGAAHAAQDATPAATPSTDEQGGVPFMFVQTFGAGSLAPKDGEDGTLTLTADHLAGQTIYFSDRPERIVGMVSTERFLGTGSGPSTAATPEGGIGFTPDDPPNAALVFASDEGDSGPGDVLVVELIDPTYDPTTGTATYDVRVLADETAVDLNLEQQPLSAAEAARSFEAASLFIDDCPDGTINCYSQIGATLVGTINVGFCWQWGDACCGPCASTQPGYWGVTCSGMYPACDPDEGGCNATWSDSLLACNWGTSLPS